jgi:DNA-binding NarL/FixJ family response regulator
LLVDRTRGLERAVRDALAGSRFAVATVVPDAEAVLMAEAPAALALVCCDNAPGRPGELSVLGELVPELSAVAILSAVGRQAVRRALVAGARGVVSERDLATMLVTCLEAAACGLVAVPAERAAELDRPVLSHREKQALWLAAQGMSNSQIAARLLVAESTIKSHLSASFRKLGVRSRSEAAALVLDRAMAADLGMSAVPC